MSPHLILALYQSDRGWGRRRSAAQRAALEDSDLFPGGQWDLASGRSNFHSAACKPARPDGRLRQHGDFQHRRVGDGDRHDRPDVGPYLHGALSAKLAIAALMANTAPCRCVTAETYVNFAA